MAKQQNGLCAQSDQSLLSTLRSIGSLPTHKTQSEHSDQTGWTNAQADQSLLAA